MLYLRHGIHFMIHYHSYAVVVEPRLNPFPSSCRHVNLHLFLSDLEGSFLALSCKRSAWRGRHPEKIKIYVYQVDTRNSCLQGNPLFRSNPLGRPFFLLKTNIFLPTWHEGSVLWLWFRLFALSFSFFFPVKILEKMTLKLPTFLEFSDSGDLKVDKNHGARNCCGFASLLTRLFTAPKTVVLESPHLAYLFQMFRRNHGEHLPNDLFHNVYTSSQDNTSQGERLFRLS